MMTYIGMEAPRPMGIRLGVIGGPNSELTASYSGAVLILPPTGMSPDVVQLLQKATFDQRTLLEEPESQGAFVDHIRHHAALASTAIREVSKVNDGVSDAVQVGIQSMDLIWVSEIVHPDEPPIGIA
jgi:hypothetical protein